ncbi:MAG: hypothetical protein OXH52_22400 [Gammaproteobacteria bacterium]|nr:hypothetical protein [Gammaproteobacteria bacterium]
MPEVGGILEVVVEGDTVPEFQRIEELIGEHAMVCEQECRDYGKLDPQRVGKPVPETRQ